MFKTDPTRAVGGPIGAAVGAAVGAISSLISNAFGGAEKRENRRQRQVEAARKRQAFTFLEPKIFSFANAPTIREIFNRTLLERPRGSFLAAAQPVGFTTGRAAGQVINLNVTQQFEIHAQDSEDVDRFFRRNASVISRTLSGEIEETIRRSTFTSSALTSRLEQLANRV